MSLPKSDRELYRELKGAMLQIGTSIKVSGPIRDGQLEYIQRQAAARIGFKMFEEGLLEFEEEESSEEDREYMRAIMQREYRVTCWAVHPKGTEVHAKELAEAKRAGRLEAAQALRDAADTLAITQGRWNLGVIVLRNAADEIEAKSAEA